jgi:hypothetical protein
MPSAVIFLNCQLPVLPVAAYCIVKVFVPAVRPDIIVVPVVVLKYAGAAAEVEKPRLFALAAIVEAPDTAKETLQPLPTPLFAISADTVMSADVPVTNVTEGLVPGLPERVAVNDVLVDVP